MHKARSLRIHEKIKSRRFEKGVGEIEFAHLVRLSVSEYGDIEHSSDEIYSVVPLYNIKKICYELDFNFLELFDMACGFCDQKTTYVDDFWLSRNSLIEKKRKELGLSQSALGDRLGFHEAEIKLLETYTAHLESWVLENILWMAEILRLPAQILLDVKCQKCGR